MTIITADATRGFDVMRGKTVVAHFDSYEPAWAYTRLNGLTLRYWAAKSSQAGEAKEA